MSMNVKKVKARIHLWKATPYKDAYIYVRKIDTDIFEYLVCWNGQMYTDYYMIPPAEGKKSLSKKEELSCLQTMYAAAETTVDMLRGEGVTGEEAEKAQAMIDVLQPNKTQIEGTVH